MFAFTSFLFVPNNLLPNQSKEFRKSIRDFESFLVGGFFPNKAAKRFGSLHCFLLLKYDRRNSGHPITC